jgi:hypothetical protein
MARTFSHQALAAPSKKWVVYRTFSFGPTPVYSSLFSMVWSQSSASRGSVDLEKVGVLEVHEYGMGLVTSIATIVVAIGDHLGKVLKCGKIGLALGAGRLTVLHHNVQ